MHTLQHILYKVPITQVIGSTAMGVAGIAIDSRSVVANGTFIAIIGEVVDGHSYIHTAIEQGATSIVCSVLPLTLHPNITYVVTPSTQLAAGIMAHNYYNTPSTQCTLVGVTGTNGKTTVATLLFQLYTQLGYTCGLVSTVHNIIGNTIIQATHTTPDAVTINALLHQMVQSGCTHIFMEVSSHALHQHRTAGLQFAAGIFTNISHDHLDYHKTFDEYIKVKKSFFDNLPATAYAITNIDDKRGAVMLQNTNAHKVTYGIHNMGTYKCKILDNALTGLQLNINDVEVHCRLIGIFNAYNLIAVYATAMCLQQNSNQVLEVLSNLQGAIGRFDYVITPKQKIIAIVDYAHTPDALQNVLATIKSLNQAQQQVITVVGCGGNRDRTKRPIMAAVACTYSTVAIFTADNPRYEAIDAILDDMQQDLTSAQRRKYMVIPSRKEAITKAMSLASNNDIVLVAGKGHETYQDINGVKSHFDDKEIIQDCIALLDK